MKIGYVGYGGFGRQIADFVREIGGRGEEYFFDDILFRSGEAGAHPFQDYAKPEFREIDQWYICLGYKNLALKTKIIKELLADGRRLPSLIHPSCFVNSSAKIGAAVYLYPRCNIDARVTLEDGVTLNNSVTVSHDTRIGASTFLSPGVIVAGTIDIGAGVFIGTGAVISAKLSIGDGAVIGFASAVGGDVPAGAHVIGNPLRKLSHPLKIV